MSGMISFLLLKMFKYRLNNGYFLIILDKILNSVNIIFLKFGFIINDENFYLKL